MPATVPRWLGKYEVLRHLSQGGMAELFLGRVTGIEGFEKVVVLKRILPWLASDTEVVRLFLQEARLAATLHHPNIAQVYDVGSDEGFYYFAMEYVHGVDLRALLDRRAGTGRRLEIDLAITIALGVCAGLHYAHSKLDSHGNPSGIIHCDISPSNIMLAYDGSVRITDFGIARVERKAAETTSGALRGKFEYMSPEQCQSRSLDRRTDVFALATVLFEMTTGTSPFRRDSDFEIMKEIVEGPVPRPSALVPKYPKALERIVMRGLAKSTEDRYATAEHFQLALEEFARERKLAVSPIRVARALEERFGRELQAWRRASAAGIGLGQHLSATMSIVSPEPDVSDVSDVRDVGDVSDVRDGSAPPAQAPQPSPRRAGRWVIAGLGASALVATVGLVAYGGSESPPPPPPTLPAMPPPVARPAVAVALDAGVEVVAPPPVAVSGDPLPAPARPKVRHHATTHAAPPAANEERAVQPPPPTQPPPASPPAAPANTKPWDPEAPAPPPPATRKQ